MQIVFQFDIRTIAVFVALTFFVQATAIGAQALLIRELKQYRGVLAALLANLCAAASLLLRLFASRLPEYPAILLSNALLLASRSPPNLTWGPLRRKRSRGPLLYGTSNGTERVRHVRAQ